MRHSEAFEKLLGHEGFYSNDPDDNGGETIYGIARKYHPSARVWVIIDAAKKEPGFPNSLKRNTDLVNAAQEFYKAEFWDELKCDSIDDPLMQYELYDTAVNQGAKTAAKFFQRALNLCNRNQQDYPDILDDGAIGNTTLSVYARSRKKNIYKTVNLLQGERYMNIVRKTPSQEKYFNGWLNRVEFSQG